MKRENFLDKRERQRLKKDLLSWGVKCRIKFKWPDVITSGQCWEISGLYVFSTKWDQMVAVTGQHRLLLCK